MDISKTPGVSAVLGKEVLTAIDTSVLKMTMDQQTQQSAELINEMSQSQVAAATGLGKNIDIRI